MMPLDVVQVVERFEQQRLGGLRWLSPQPMRQGSDVGHPEAITGPHEDSGQGRRVAGITQHAQPGMQFDDLGHIEQSTEVGDLDRYVLIGENVSHHRDVLVLPEQHGHLPPGGAGIMERPHLSGDPSCFIPRGAEPFEVNGGLIRPGQGHEIGGIIGEQRANVVGSSEDRRAGSTVDRQRQGD